MADTKITALTAITTVDPAADVLPIVDVSDTSMAASGTTKKITSNQILGAGGTATLASATITGDLTVDTNVLKVDSANNYVGIGTASPVQSLTISGEASVRVNDLIYWNGYYNAGFKARAAGYAAYIGEATSGDFVIANTASSAAGAGSSLSFLDRYRISNSGVHTWEYVGGVAGTAMTLNSTGLGVGVTPSAKLDVSANDGTMAIFRSSGGSSNDKRLTISTGGAKVVFNISDNSNTATARAYEFQTAGSAAMTLDASGNVGIGVTPSAGGSNYYKTLEIGKAGCGLFTATASLSGSELTYLSGNGVLAYNAGPEWTYGNNGAAAIYGIEDGVHKWYNATTGTAGVVFTPTQAMTLDASGTLLVGTTSAGASGFRCYLSTDSGTTKWSVGPYVSATNFAIVASGSAGGVYLNGTTATSWTALSDERFKDIIEPISNAVAKVGSLRAVIGKIKGDETNTRKSFLIAQDVESVLPEAVDASNPDRLGLAYTDVIPLLVAAIKELTAEVNALKNA